MALDPFTAISLAGNVMQFLGFASAAISKGYALYKAPDGSLRDHVDLETATHDLIELNSRLADSLRRGNDVDYERHAKSDKALGELISGCVAVGHELLSALAAMKVKGEKYRTWKSICAGIRSTWSKAEVESVSKRLALYRGELEIHLLVDLREQVHLQQLEQSSRFKELDRLTQDMTRSLLTGEDVFAALIHKQTDQLAQMQNRTTTRMIEEFAHTRLEFHEALKHKGHGHAADRVDIRPVFDGDDVLSWNETSLYDQQLMRDVRDSLYYPAIRDRHIDIPSAYHDTFNWIFRPPTVEDRKWDSFRDWLQQGSGVYWISGKPGSGKSTLMKFLYNHPQTLDSLQIWAERDKLVQRQLVMAGFFFWNSGKTIQKTQEGLLRSLLWTVLRMCPALCPVVLRDIATEANRGQIKSGRFEWTRAQLMQLMSSLVSQQRVPVRLFLLIDGLDEYEGDHHELAEWFMKVASPWIKIVLSSRPWNAFRDTFESVAQLRVQDLTYQDITNYVKGNLESHPRMVQILAKEEEKARSLVAEIVGKADGVFLWVKLVVASLLDGLRNHDRVSDLQHRLFLLPADLETLYDHLLRTSSGSIYSIQQSRYIRIRQAASEPPLTLTFSLADEEDTSSLFSGELTIMTRGEALDRCEEVERRLQASCAGLLEVDYREKTFLSEEDRLVAMDNHDYYKSAFGSRIQYIHRTVRDYLDRLDIAAQIDAAVSESAFDPNFALCRGWVYRMLRMPYQVMGAGSMETLGIASLDMIYREAQAFEAAISPDSDKRTAARQLVWLAQCMQTSVDRGDCWTAGTRHGQIIFLQNLQTLKRPAEIFGNETSERKEQKPQGYGVSDANPSSQDSSTKMVHEKRSSDLHTGAVEQTPLQSKGPHALRLVCCFA